MTDRPTALDRLRAGLGRRQETPPPAGADGPGPQASPEPPKAAAPPDEPAPMDEPAPQIPETPPAARDERPRTAPEPQAMDTARLRAMQETLDRQKLRHREDRSGTRLRINLTWAAAVTLISAFIVAAAYLPAFPMQDDLFRRLWPWRAHVWNVYGGGVIWCINEARKRNEPFLCRIHFDTYGPDCPRPETGGVGAAHRCPPWETWPTDPAPRWSADGLPQWSR